MNFASFTRHDAGKEQKKPKKKQKKPKNKQKKPKKKPKENLNKDSMDESKMIHCNFAKHK